MKHKLNLFKNDKQTLHIFFPMTEKLLQNSPISIFYPPTQNTLMQIGLKKANRLATKTVAVDSSNKKVTTSNMRLYIFLKYDMFTYSNFCLQLKQGRK